MRSLIKGFFRASSALVLAVRYTFRAVWYVLKDWRQYYKTRFQLFWKRYNRLIISCSLIITYLTGFVIVFNLYQGLSQMIYGVVFVVLLGVITIIPVTLFICSLFPKGRHWFDEWFNYEDDQLIPRTDRIEKEIESIKERLQKLEDKQQMGEAIMERLSDKEIEQSRQRAEKRLQEDIERVGYQRGKLFQTKTGKWAIAWEESASVTVGVSVPEVKIKQKDSGGFTKVKAISRSKKGGESGRPAKEELTIDRTDPKKTTKTHKVSEQNEQGEWKEVHNTREDFPAKRREPKSVSRKAQT